MSGQGDSRWVIAVDGGGSKIDIAALDLSIVQASIATARRWNFPGTGSAHPTAWPHAQKNLANALQSVIASLKGMPSQIVLALAGAGRNEDRLRVVDYFREQCEFGSSTPITCVGDIDPIVDFGEGAVDSIAIILGTGSIVATRNLDGQLVRAGGWGPNLGDECSGTALGNLALRSAVAWFDSGAELVHAGPLARRVIEALRAKAKDPEKQTLDVERDTIAQLLIDRAADRTATAGLFGLVIELALNEDKECLQLVRAQVDRLAAQVEQVWRRSKGLGRNCQLVFSGGVAQRELIRKMIVTNCQERGLPVIGSIVADPLLAALKYALRIGGK